MSSLQRVQASRVGASFVKICEIGTASEMPAQAEKYAPLISSGFLTLAECNSRFLDLQLVRLEEAPAFEIDVFLGSHFRDRAGRTPLASD